MNNTSFSNLIESDQEYDQDEKIILSKENEKNLLNISSSPEKNINKIISDIKNFQLSAPDDSAVRKILPIDSIESSTTKVPKQIIDNTNPLPKYRPIKPFQSTSVLKTAQQSKPSLSIFNSLKKNVPLSKIDERKPIPTEKVSSQSFDIKATSTYQKQIIPVDEQIAKPMRISADGKIETNNCEIGKSMPSTTAATTTGNHYVPLLLNNNENNFQTPQFKSFSNSIRIGGNSINRNAGMTLKSQSRLYSTPIAIPYPQSAIILPPTKNDSIGLTLDDTIPIDNENNKKSDSLRISSPIDDSSLFGVNSSIDTNKQKNQIHVNGITYSLDKKIGSGASSSVFLAYRKGDRQQCAVKVVDLHGDPVVIHGYINETKLLAKLQGNESVIKLLE